MRSDMLRGATNGSIVPVPKSLNRLAEIAQEVPSIGDLDSTRGTLTDAFGVGTRTIAGDYLDTGPTTQPGSDGGGLTIGQEIDHVVRLDVDEPKQDAAGYLGSLEPRYAQPSALQLRRRAQDQGCAGDLSAARFDGQKGRQLP